MPLENSVLVNLLHGIMCERKRVQWDFDDTLTDIHDKLIDIEKLIVKRLAERQDNEETVPDSEGN